MFGIGMHLSTATTFQFWATLRTFLMWRWAALLLHFGLIQPQVRFLSIEFSNYLIRPLSVLVDEHIYVALSFPLLALSVPFAPHTPSVVFFLLYRTLWGSSCPPTTCPWRWRQTIWLLLRWHGDSHWDLGSWQYGVLSSKLPRPINARELWHFNRHIL